MRLSSDFVGRPRRGKLLTRRALDARSHRRPRTYEAAAPSVHTATIKGSLNYTGLWEDSSCLCWGSVVPASRPGLKSCDVFGVTRIDKKSSATSPVAESATLMGRCFEARTGVPLLLGC